MESRFRGSGSKGGDKIVFGQLEARYRERAPKGLAPAESSGKPSSGKAAEPTRSDGRRGDTESVPSDGHADIS